MATTATRHRLVTRSDFDGLVCAALLKQLDMLEDILFVHPKDMQDGKIELRPTDITTNLPYVPGVHLAFDHHHSELERVGAESPDNHVIDPHARSAARVVYDHFGGDAIFGGNGVPWYELMAAVDKADSADFSQDEILAPSGWILLSFLMDPRTGLGRFRDFRISNYQLMMQLIDQVTTMTVDEVLASPDVAERVALYDQHARQAVQQIRACSRIEGDIVVLDLRNEEVIHPTNRFMIYALHPLARISVHVLWGLKQQNTVFAVGKSIVDRTSPVDVGAVMLEYGGGGHEAAGTCQVANEDAERLLPELVEKLRSRY
jgi:nanoRNase/pAp phosphatase (c-di-AMP/oligoRNAs hydrolase)